MTVDTHVEQALDRVHEEQEAIEKKQAAYKRFVKGVEKSRSQLSRLTRHSPSEAGSR